MYVCMHGQTFQSPNVFLLKYQSFFHTLIFIYIGFSVFITEQDGTTIRRISKSSRDHHHHDDDISRDQGNSSRELNIVEHRDPKSGIRIRLKKKSSRTSRVNSRSARNPNGEGFGFEHEGGMGSNDAYNDRDGMDTNDLRYGQRGEMGSNGSFDDIYEDVNSTELDSESGYGNSRRALSSRRRKPKSRYSIYYQERDVKSDSELHIPSERYLFLNRIRKKRSSREQEARMDGQKTGNESNSLRKKIAARSLQKTGNEMSGNQSYADDESVSSSDEWERVGTGEPVGTLRRNAGSASLVEMVCLI